jgi:hypothetical protein
LAFCTAALKASSPKLDTASADARLLGRHGTGSRSLPSSSFRRRTARL